MSTIIPVPPIVAMLAQSGYNFPQWSNTAQIVNRDGQTNAKMLEAILFYMDSVLVPGIDQNMIGVTDAWKETVTQIISNYDALKDEFLSNGAEVNDQIIALLLADNDSALSVFLDSLGSGIRDAVASDLPANIKDTLQPDSVNDASVALEKYVASNLVTPYRSDIMRNGRFMNPRFKDKVAAVKAGTASMRILGVGDSTLAGIGSSGSYANEKSWLTECARMFHNDAVSSAFGLSIPPSNNAPTSDDRWTLGNGWSPSTTTGAGLGGRRTAFKASPGSGYLNFTERRFGVRSYDIYYLKNASTAAAGIIEASMQGGTPVSVDTGGVPHGVGKLTVTAPADTTTGVNIRNIDTVGDVWVIGIEPTNPGQRVYFGNAGVSGSNTTQWLEKASGNDWWNAAAFFQTYQPDVVIIDLGINDSSDNVPVATYIANLQALAQAAEAAGAQVILKTFIPSSGSVRETVQPQYIAAILAGQVGNYPIIDVYSHYKSWAKTNARGLMADWGHGNDAMYLDEARIVAEVLFRYSGQ